jgi:predicted acylesterase/phospholipase RssA
MSLAVGTRAGVDMRKRRGKKLGLVLSGGGARGVFQVGVYERLIQDERFSRGPSVVSGTSAGAINAALIAAGKSPREMMRFWNEIADNPPVVASAKFFRSATRTLGRILANETGRWFRSGEPWYALAQRARNHLPPRRGSLLALGVEYLLTVRFDLVSELLEGIEVGYLADTNQLRALLVDTFGGEIVPIDGVDLAINTVDARTGRVVRYVTADVEGTRTPDYIVVDAVTVDMVLASASIPLLFPAVEIGPHLLWDGGLLVNTPLAPVVAMGAEEVVTVLVTEPADPCQERLEHFGRALERTIDSFLENAYNVDRKLLLERNRLAGLSSGSYRNVVLYDAVRPARTGHFDAGSYLYFQRSVLQKMRSLGRQAADGWLAEGPPVDQLADVARPRVRADGQAA